MQKNITPAAWHRVTSSGGVGLVAAIFVLWSMWFLWVLHLATAILDVPSEIARGLGAALMFYVIVVNSANARYRFMPPRLALVYIVAIPWIVAWYEMGTLGAPWWKVAIIIAPSLMSLHVLLREGAQVVRAASRRVRAMP